MIKNMKINRPSCTALLFCALFLVAVLPAICVADVSITPLLIDLELEAREITTSEITLTNDTDRKRVVFATVNEVAIDTTGEVKEFVSPVMTDRTNTVTSWIEITRGRIELEPGETKKIPLTVRVHPYAEFGDYFAFIGFVESSKRPQAEAAALQGNASGVILKLSLKDEKIESLRISAFLVDRFIFNTDKSTVDIEIENAGDEPSVPAGEVIFYNSRGEEISSLIFNEAAISIAPGEKKLITMQIPFSEKFGKFKANVALEYEGSQTASVFDTTQFFMIPFRLMLMFIFGVLVTTITITFLLRRAFYNDLHDDDDGSVVPLYVRNNKDHNEKDHDIHIQKS